MISPWGSYPGYLSRMQRGFRRASEEAWGVDLSYHLGRWGLPSLSGFGSYTRGVGARDPNTRESLGDVQEWNLTLDFRPAESRPWWLRGAWLRLRGSVVDEDGAPKTSKEFRIIFNYEIPVL